MGRSGRRCIFRAKRSKAGYGPLRQKRAIAPLAASIVFLLAGPARATHAPPSITNPDPGAFVNTGIVSVEGQTPGDAQLIRVFEGATPLADTGPVSGYWAVGIALADGVHTLTAKACDAGATSCSAASPGVTFTVDTIAPGAPWITAPANGSLLGFSVVTVEGTAEENSEITVTASTGATLTATASAAGTWTAERSFPDGSHTLRARARDRAGNTSLESVAVTFTVDTIAPLTPVIQTPVNGMSFGSPSVRVAGTADPGTTVTVHEGATIATTTATSAGTWSVTPVFAEGPHSITARAMDAAGNVSPASPSVSFTVDLTPPPAPVISAPAEDAFLPSEVTITGSAEPRATVLLIIGNVLETQTQADQNGAWSISMTLHSGPHTIKVRARDAAGNLGPLSDARTFTVDSEWPTVDITTKHGTIFLPSEDVFIDGLAEDNLGVLRIELEYYDLLGRAVATARANRCFPCPTGTTIAWSSDHSPGRGRFVVKAYAVDRAGNRSLPDSTTIIRV